MNNNKRKITDDIKLEMNVGKKSGIELDSNVRLEIYREGELIATHFSHNLMPTVGENHVASALAGVATAMTHMAVGTGTTAAAAGDTTLETEIARVALDSTTPVTNVVTYIATFPPGTGTGAITEAGIFNAGAAGTLLVRDVFSVKNKDAGDQFVFTWTVTNNDDGV